MTDCKYLPLMYVTNINLLLKLLNMVTFIWKMQDGPQGFRTTDKTGGFGTSTAWPSAMAIAASWDTDLAYRWARSMAKEFKDKGANVQLGPGIGIARVPTAGRNFEYLCGEDPYLGALLVQPVVKGIQENGVIANAKHFVNNEIEDNRKKVSANVKERVQFELYYPPFQAAVQAGVLSVMCSYNLVNGVHACQNAETLSHLRDDMGFSGWVMTDWLANPATVASVHAGVDQEMPLGLHYSEEALLKALTSGDISISEIDKSVHRILTSMFTIGLFDSPPSGDPKSNVTSDEHNALAREIAGKSIVLVKNDNDILPLNTASSSLGDCIAVIGDSSTSSGGGSGHVEAAYTISPADGIANALSGTTTKVLYNTGVNIAEAASIASQCSTAVVIVATTSSEGSDRPSLSLGDAQDRLVNAVAAVQPRTIVAVGAPGAVLLPWTDSVAAVLIHWMPGQEYGNALADVLFGVINPSGKLPVTIPNYDNEVAFTPDQYPGVGNPPEAIYSEELLIGYRWYDAKNVNPKYPFGFGLSYSSFRFDSLRVSKVADGAVKVTVMVKNNGSVAGTETIQVYVQFPEAAQEPPKQLRNFKKVYLQAQEEQQVSFNLLQSSFSVWNSDQHKWEVIAGEYQLLVGSSSRNIVLSQLVSF